MATDKQIAANRRNAQKSTGPKSLAGRARSSRNSLRHGLTKPLTDDPAILTVAHQLAAAIAVDEPGLQSNDAALEIALAQLEIRRIRTARNRALSVLLGSLSDRDPLAGYERYERIAIRRRKSAIRKLGASQC